MNNSTREDEICAFVVDMHEALTAFGVTAGMPSDQRREELRATLTESTPSPVPPPDDAPEWRDVPIEHVPRGNFLNIEAGDRYANHPTRGWSTLKDGTISFTRAHVDYWIKRHIHPVSKPAPQTQAWRQVDSCPCCGYAGQWRDDSGRPDVCVKCKRGAGHPFAQPQTVEVLGRDMRKGDTVVAYRNDFGWQDDFKPWIVGAHSDNVGAEDVMYRVQLPRPDAEPNASSKGIARDAWPLMPYVDSILDAVLPDHVATDPNAFLELRQKAVPFMVAATRELRERCERAERRDASLVKRTADCTIQIDGLLREIKTLTAERDGLQDGLQVANHAAERRGAERDKYKRLAKAAEQLAKAARRWKASDHDVSDKDAACQALADASDAYEAMATGTPPQASAPSVEPARLKVWDAIKAYNQAQNVLTISLINTTLAELIAAVENNAQDTLHRETLNTKEATEALEHATGKRFQAERERDLALMRLRTANNNTKAAEVRERDALARATRAEALLKATRKDIMTALKDQRDD